jgi:hypothetical protein
MKSIALQLKLAAVAISVSAALAACGGSSPHNAAPKVVAIADQSLDQDTPTAPLSVMVSDVETPADKLQITLATSDPAVIPMDGLQLSGSGGSRLLTVTPAQGATGTATVSLVVIDAAGASTTSSFKVTVKPVLAQFAALSKTLYAQPANADPQRVDNVTFTFDVDDDPDAFDMLLGQ